MKDERLAAQDELLDRLAQMISRARQESDTAAQAWAEALAYHDSIRLDLTVDRFIATAERVLAAWKGSIT